MLSADSLGFRNSVRVALLVVAGILANAGTATAGWLPGDVITYTQVSWPENPVAANLLTDQYGPVYSSSSDVFQVGWTSGFRLVFGDADHVIAFLPQLGVSAALNESQTNPGSTNSGLFAGDVVALQLNVDFSDAGYLVGTSGIPFGDLVLANFTDRTYLSDYGDPNLDYPLPLAILNGLTVRQYLAAANKALGGGGPSFGESIEIMDAITEDLNISFDSGSVDHFAQDHLIAPSTPVSSVPEPSSWVLLGSGLLGLAAVRRRQRRR